MTSDQQVAGMDFEHHHRAQPAVSVDHPDRESASARA